jgi:hypothetical protein
MFWVSRPNNGYAFNMRSLRIEHLPFTGRHAGGWEATALVTAYHRPMSAPTPWAELFVQATFTLLRAQPITHQF